MKTCCFTGHRNLNHIQTDVATFQLFKVINDLVEDGYTHFISGFAKGADLLFADVITQFKKINSNISLEAAIPYKDNLNCKVQGFNELLGKCDSITVVQEKYHISCFQKRSKYMVDSADVVVAVWDGKENGSIYNTISYAKSRSKRIIVINV